MEINLLYDKYKKDIIDICRIFPMDDPVFSQTGSIIIDKNKIILDREYDFSSKLDLKRILYNYLSNKHDYKSPWGIITGTKPQKLFEKYLSQSNLENLKADYYINEDKISLLKAIHDSHKNIVYDQSNLHLYINIPFCPSRCSYCSFPTIIYKNNDRRQEYLNFLKIEIEKLKEYINQRNLRSIYIGGGTPSSLTTEQMKDLLGFMDANFDLASLEEFTFEAGREDTLNEERLKVLKAFHVSRISLNPQTFIKGTLESIYREFDLGHFTQIYDMANAFGFDVNMDLILGLSDEDIEDLKVTLDYVGEFMPDNLTVHTLSLKRGSKLNDSLSERLIKNDIEQLVDYSQKRAIQMGYKPYYLYRQKEILGNFENVGYCLNDNYSIYNIVTNEEKETILGLGMTSNSKIFVDGKLFKYTNYKNLDDYINKLDEQVNEKIRLLEKKI